MGLSSSKGIDEHYCYNVGTSIPSRERALAAIVGAFVADAATMPLHWIYDQTAIEDIIKNKAKRDIRAHSGPEFYDPPQCPFYHYEVGTLSPYGDECFVLLRLLANKGFFDIEAARSHFYEFYSRYCGRLSRICQSYVERREAGASWDDCAHEDDTQFVVATRLPVLVARYAGCPKLMSKVDELVRVHHRSDKVLAAARLAARLLEKTILGSSIHDALKWARHSQVLGELEIEYLDHLDDMVQRNLPFSLAAETCGLSGHLPGSLRAALYGLKSFRGYEVCVRANMAAGGDSVCRVWFLAAMLAAEGGESVIPEAWKQNVAQFEEIHELATRVCGSNAYFDQCDEKSCKLPVVF